jgi:GNAT superfamily N-acetyltransferase
MARLREIPESRRKWGEEARVSSLDFGLAREPDDFDGAFRLLHDQYVRRGYMVPHPSGRRLNVYNALPSTKVFVVKAEAQVVATVTLVEDSPIGLPMDEIFRGELAGLRARGRRLAEASSLAVHPDYRRSGMAILLRLYRMVLLYAARIARLNDLCFVVRPRHMAFYPAGFPMQQVGPPRPYGRINGATAVGFRVELGLVRALLRVLRAGLSPAERRGFLNFVFGPASCRQVLARLRRDLPGSALTPAHVAHFFGGHGAESALLTFLSVPYESDRAQDGHDFEIMRELGR